MKRLPVLLLLCVGLAPAYQLEAVVIDGGGTRLSSPGYACGMSAGQTVASGWLAGTGFRAVLGFWHRPLNVIGIQEPEVEPMSTEPLSPTVLRSPDLAKTDCRVLDITGRDVTERKISLSPGVYFLKLSAGGGELKAVRKVVVQR